MTARRDMRPDLLEKVQAEIPDWVRGGDNQYPRVETERLQEVLYGLFEKIAKLQEDEDRQRFVHENVELNRALSAQIEKNQELDQRRYADLRALMVLLNHLYRLLRTPMDQVGVIPRGKGEETRPAVIGLDCELGRMTAVLGSEIEFDPGNGKPSEIFALDEGGIDRLQELAFLALAGLPPDRAYRAADLVRGQLIAEEKPAPTCSHKCGYVPSPVSASPSMEVAAQVRERWRQMGLELVPLPLLFRLLGMLNNAGEQRKSD